MLPLGGLQKRCLILLPVLPLTSLQKLCLILRILSLIVRDLYPAPFPRRAKPGFAVFFSKDLSGPITYSYSSWSVVGAGEI